jgi:hypothetical protein
MFLAGDYERVIRIFKLYSTKFDTGEWDDKLGDILKKLYTKNEIIKRLERERLSSSMSSNLRRRTGSNFSFLEQPISQDKSWLRRKANNASRLFKTSEPAFQQSMRPIQPIEKQSWFRKQASRLFKPSNQELQQSMLQTQPIEQQSMLTQVPVLPTINLSQYSDSFSGGSKIKLRTFHFLEPKSYNEHAFRAEKPIIAGKMAYDFLRTHYKLKKESSIMFTIEDRIKNKKYNYIGEKVNNKIIIKST